MPPLDPAGTRCGIVRVPRVPLERVQRLLRAERELAHVRLGEHDRAGLFDLLHLERVFVGHEPLHRDRPGGALKPDRLEVVLHDHGHAVQRSGQSLLRKPPVHLLGFLDRVRIGHDDRVQRGALLVELLDALQVRLDERAARQLLRAHRRVDVGDRGFLDVERLVGRRPQAKGQWEKAARQRENPNRAFHHRSPC